MIGKKLKKFISASLIVSSMSFIPNNDCTLFNQTVHAKSIIDQAKDSKIYKYYKIIKTGNTDSGEYEAFNQGMKSYEQKDYDNALKKFQEAIKLNSKFSTAYSMCGLVYKELGNYDLAVENITKAIEIEPGHYWNYYSRADAYTKMNQFDKAVADFTKIIQIEPNKDFGYLSRGYVCYETKKYNNAIEDFTKALQLNPNENFDTAEIYEYRGKCYEALGETEKAQSDFNKAKNLKSDESLVKVSQYLKSAMESYTSKNYQQTIEDCTKIIELKPDNYEAYYWRGLSYESLQEYQKAKLDFTKTIELNPEYKVAYDMRALINYYHLKDYQAAIDDYTKIIELSSENDNLYLCYQNRGECYKKLKDKAKAKADLQKAKELYKRFY